MLFLSGSRALVRAWAVPRRGAGACATPAAAANSARPPAPAALCAAWSAARAAAAGGPLLVLDAGSLFPPPTRIYGGGSTISSIGPAKGEEVKQPMASASECQARCEVLPGCGSFAFCGEEGGCGAGCASYVEAHPRERRRGRGRSPGRERWGGVCGHCSCRLSSSWRGSGGRGRLGAGAHRVTSAFALGPRWSLLVLKPPTHAPAARPSPHDRAGHVVKDGEDPFASLKLPLRSFGPFLAATSGPTGCQKGAPDKWPQGMCVLYTQAGNASATLAAGGGGRNKRNAAGVLGGCSGRSQGQPWRRRHRGRGARRAQPAPAHVQQPLGLLAAA